MGDENLDQKLHIANSVNDLRVLANACRKLGEEKEAKEINESADSIQALARALLVENFLTARDLPVLKLIDSKRDHIVLSQDPRDPTRKRPELASRIEILKSYLIVTADDYKASLKEQGKDVVELAIKGQDRVLVAANDLIFGKPDKKSPDKDWRVLIKKNPNADQQRLEIAGSVIDEFMDAVKASKTKGSDSLESPSFSDNPAIMAALDANGFNGTKADTATAGGTAPFKATAHRIATGKSMG